VRCISITSNTFSFSKLKKTSKLRADTGDDDLNEKIEEKKYMKVVQGFREYKLVEVQV